jgi:putative flippase GtrA
MKNYLKTFANSESLVQVIKVGIIGVLNTVVSLVLFRVLLIVLGGEEERSGGFDLQVLLATVISFALTTLMSYMLNRRWTFQFDKATGGGSETVRFFAINGVALGVTTLVVNGANAVWGPLSDNALTVAYVAAAGLIILPKFAGYRDVVFRKALHASANDGDSATAEVRQ